MLNISIKNPKTLLNRGGLRRLDHKKCNWIIYHFFFLLHPGGSYFKASADSAVSRLWKSLLRENSDASLPSPSIPMTAILSFSCYSFSASLLYEYSKSLVLLSPFHTSYHCILCSSHPTGFGASLLGHTYLFCKEDAISLEVFFCGSHSLLMEKYTNQNNFKGIIAHKRTQKVHWIFLNWIITPRMRILRMRR